MYPWPPYEQPDGTTHHNGDPVDGSTPDADGYQQMLDELCHIVNHAGLEWSKADSQQVRKAVSAMIAAAVAQGMTWSNQTANMVFAGPTAGAASTPGFRTLVPADLPSGISVDPIIGSARNVRMSLTAATATATLTADAVIVGTTLGGTAKKLSSYNKTVNLATTGAGGMDTGAAPASGYVSVYAIAKADGTANVLACAVATSSGAVYGGANMPAGYTMSALLAIWPTTGAGLLSVGQLIDRRVWIATTSNLTGGTATSYTAVTMSVPAAAKSVIAQLGATYSNNSVDAYLASDSAGVICVQQSPQSASAGNTPRLVAELPLITAQTLYYKMGGSTTTSASVSTLGYTF